MRTSRTRSRIAEASSRGNDRSQQSLLTVLFLRSFVAVASTLLKDTAASGNMSGQQGDQPGSAAATDSSEPLRVIKNLLTSYHESNQEAGAQQLYDMAKDHAAEVVQSDLLPFLVIMLEAKQEATRAAAAAALAGLAAALEGRDAVRRSGALQPLTLLLREGPVSRAAAQAARAIANAAASDVIKEALWEVGALPLLANLVRRGADARTGSLHAIQAAAAPAQAAGSGEGSSEDARSGPIFNVQSSLNAAAVFAVGALVNLVLHAKCAATLQQACPELPALLQEVARGHSHDMLGQRCRLVLQLLGAGLGNQDFRVPGEKGVAERYLNQARRAGQLEISTGGSAPEAPPPLEEESSSSSSQLAAVLSQIGFKNKDDLAEEAEAAAGGGLIAAGNTSTRGAAAEGAAV